MSFDADRIAPHLWMGAFPSPASEVRRRHFDVLVLCAEERQEPNWFPGVIVVAAPMDDGPVTPQLLYEAKFAAGKVVEFLRAGKRVLVTCNQGRNRSGLVVALTLISLGVPPRDAIAMIRNGRGPDALVNPWFLDYLVPERRESLGYLYPV